MIRSFRFGFSVVFLFAIALACYRRPIDNLDRYIYEGIVRERTQSLDSAYEAVKHEDPRAESSTVLDSPEHLREVAPMYAIRPIYLELIALSGRFLPLQKAIGLISAASLFGLGIVVLEWTKRPLECALLMAVYPILALGRLGTPDALAALFSVSALWLIDCYGWRAAPLLALFVSLGVRTDNLILLLAVLAWLAWEKRIPVYLSSLLALLAVSVVLGINHWAHNYGWMVLFRCSFLGGAYPAHVPHTFTLEEYLSTFVANGTVLFSQISFWILMGVWAWMRRPARLLLVVAVAVAAHFLLYPSPEDRYLIWGCIIAPIALMQSFEKGIVPA